MKKRLLNTWVASFLFTFESNGQIKHPLFKVIVLGKCAHYLVVVAQNLFQHGHPALPVHAISGQGVPRLWHDPRLHAPHPL